MEREALEALKQTVTDREVAEAYDRAYAQGGYRGAMRLRAELGVRRSESQYVSPTSIAGFYASAGEQELALDWLEKAYAERDIQMVRIKCSPRWDPLREHPRFRDLVRSMNLPR